MEITRNNVTATSSITTPLALCFIVLKLTEVIDWSWVWVLAPLWMPLAGVIIVFLLAMIVSLIASNFIK